MLTNSQGFKRFFELYFEPVYRFVRKYTEEDAIARDITQDTFIRLYERRRDFDVPEKAKSFIYITARNLWRRWRRSRGITASSSVPPVVPMTLGMR